MCMGVSISKLFPGSQVENSRVTPYRTEVCWALSSKCIRSSREKEIGNGN